MTVLELSHVVRQVGDFTLGPVNLRLMGPGVVGLAGPNGAGKSTLLRILATVDEPDAGAVASHGEELDSRRQRRHYRRGLGYMPQDATFPRRARCDDFLHHMAWLKEIPAGQRADHVNEALHMVDLHSRRESRIGSLSGGMLRRLNLAQAMLGAPNFLLLDEPTAGLDPEQRVAFRHLIRQAATSTPVLMATHLTEDIRAVAERIIILNAGKVIFDGDVHELERIGQEGLPGDTSLEKGLSALLIEDRAR